MVIKVWQLAAALVLLITGLPGAVYLTAHGHGAILACSVIASTTIWLGLDARKRDWSESRSRWRARSTATWVIGSLLLWVVVFPIYLAQRARVPLKDDSDEISPPAHEASMPPEISTTSTPEPGVSPGSTTAFWLAAVCAGGMALGAIGPWARGPLGTTVSGFDGANDGWILIGAAAIAGLCLWLHRRSAGRGSLTLMLLAGVIGVGVTLYDRQSVSTATRGSFDVVEVGWGVNLCLVASVGLVICVLALLARTGSRRRATSDTLEAGPRTVGQMTDQGQRPAGDRLVPPASVSAATTSEARNPRMAEKYEPEQHLPPITEQATIQYAQERPVISGGATVELERLATPAVYASGALDEEECHVAKARLLESSAISTVTTPEAPVRGVEPPGVISTLPVLMQARDGQPEFMNAQELASHLGVSERSVRRWIERGELPAEKPGRTYVIRREDGERMRSGAFGYQIAENPSQLENVAAREDGERSLLGAFESQVANDPLQLEGAAAHDRELAELRGRYKELHERLKRVERELDVERRRAIRLELERELGGNQKAAPRAA